MPTNKEFNALKKTVDRLKIDLGIAQMDLKNFYLNLVETNKKLDDLLSSKPWESVPEQPDIPSEPPPEQPDLPNLFITQQSVNVSVGQKVRLTLKGRFSTGLEPVKAKWSVSGAANLIANDLSSTDSVIFIAPFPGAYEIKATANYFGKLRGTVLSLLVTGSPSTTTPEPPAEGNPDPSTWSSRIIDMRSGGAHDLQTKTSLAELESEIEADGHSIFIDTNMFLSDDYDGNGKKAIRVEYEALLNADSGAHFQIALASPVSDIIVQWKHLMGRTVSGGGIGGIGAFDITNENDSSPNAGRKYLLLCRPLDSDPGGCGYRTDNTWSGPSPATMGVSIGAPLNVREDVPLELADLENCINQVNVFTQRFKAASSDGASDAILQIWWNGVLVLEKTDLPWKAEDIERLEFPATFRAPRIDQTEYFTDIVIGVP